MDSRKRGSTVFGRLTNDDGGGSSPKRHRREEQDGHRRKGGANRLMLQKSFAYITSMYSCTEFAQVATTDREDTISIFSRRVNTKRLTESSTTYSVLRSWVQDDPDRPPISEPNDDLSASQEVANAEADPIIVHLREVLRQSAMEKASAGGDILKSVNSLNNIPVSELLMTHVAYYKKIREIWLMIAAVRYSHLKPKLCALGAPTSSAMESILHRDKGEVTLKKLTALLGVPPKSDEEPSKTEATEVQGDQDGQESKIDC